MPDKTFSDAAEQWLEDALVEYAAAEPRLGMESHILAAIAARKTQAGWRWNAWPSFATAAALLLVVGSVLLWRLEFRPRGNGAAPAGVAEISQPSKALPAQKPQAAAQTVIEKHYRNHRVVLLAERHAAAHGDTRLLPRRALFPSPEPLTQLQKQFVEFVWSHPEEATQIAAAQREPAQLRIIPIKIEPISIPPLAGEKED